MSTATPATAADAAAASRQIKIVLPGLLIAMLLAMLDNLIIGTAMPRIVGELGGLDHLSWVVTAYILTMTVSTPLYGKLGDLFGRKRLFMGAIVLFLLGSALSGASQTMIQLIGFRALQGLGAGGLIVGVMAIIGDLVPPRDRGKIMGYTAPVMGVATIGGPLLGGLLTDHLSWRWAFYINLPLGAIALTVIALTLHLPRHKIEHKIDWLGAAVLTIGAASLVLVTSWGGNQYDWGSWQIISLAIIGVVATVAFLLVERKAQEPMIPLRLFKDRNFSVATSQGFLVGFAMFGAITFLPLFQQTVQGASATNSGLLLLPMMVPMLILGPIIGQIITRTGHYRTFPILGGGVLAAGIALMATIDVNTSKFTLGLYMVVLGIGMAMLMQLTMLLAQNGAEPRDMGVASSTSTFFRSIGGSFGVSLFGALFASRLNDGLAGIPGMDKVEGASSGNLDPAQLAQIPPAIKEPLLTALADATHYVFVWGLPFAVVAFLIGFLIKSVPLRTAAGAAAAPPAAPANGEQQQTPLPETGLTPLPEPTEPTRINGRERG
ncbi:MDR family MFS transporter [Flindersiella endophytica]